MRGICAFQFTYDLGLGQPIDFRHEIELLLFDDREPFQAICDQTHDGGGWTLAAVISKDGRVTWTSLSMNWTTGDGETETEGLFGMPEAVGELLGPIAINDVDLIVVPAAAVDATGMRMGWGRGYFDKTLGSMEKCPPVYAVLFDGELVDEVPRERHDQPVDGAVTPTRIVQFT